MHYLFTPSLVNAFIYNTKITLNKIIRYVYHIKLPILFARIQNEKLK